MSINWVGLSKGGLRTNFATQISKSKREREKNDDDYLLNERDVINLLVLEDLRSKVRGRVVYLSSSVR